MIDLNKIQAEMVEWQKYNFPGRGVHIPLLGAVEELGELAHAHIKKEQNIRLNEDHDSNKKDAIADIFIYLFDYSNDHNFNLEEIITETWNQVKSRDWIKFPKNGRTE